MKRVDGRMKRCDPEEEERKKRRGRESGRFPSLCLQRVFGCRVVIDRPGYFCSSRLLGNGLVTLNHGARIVILIVS